MGRIIVENHVENSVCVQENQTAEAMDAAELNLMTKDELIAKIRELEARLPKAPHTKQKREREFDFDRYEEQKIALKIAYFGWPYHGLAVQDHIDETIEGYLFRALITAKLVRDRSSCDFTRCGRTDKGVSAFCQVVSLNIRTNRLRQVDTGSSLDSSPVTKKVKGASDSDVPKDIAYTNIINRLLPNDIRVLAWAPVDRAFNSRFSCLSRTYKYYFWLGNRDLSKMRQAAEMFVGVHDYRNFCKIDRNNPTPNFIRHVYSMDIVIVDPTSQLYAVVVVGKAFLWHQIRCMMAVLFAVGEGNEDPSIVATMLDFQRVPSKPTYDMASELPLVLFDCTFEDVKFFGEPDEQEKLTQHLRKLWQDRQVMATMTQELLGVVDNAYLPSSSLTFQDNLSSPIPQGVQFIQWQDVQSVVKTQNKTKPYIPLLQRPRDREHT